MFSNCSADEKLKRVGMYWHYEICQVLPEYESTINLADYNNAVVIPDELIGAERFLHGNLDHALTIKPTADGQVRGYEDLVQATLDYNDFSYKKQIYYMTDADKAKATAFLKLIADLHITQHTPEGREVPARYLRKELKQQTDLIALKRKFSTYFHVDIHWKRSDLDKEKVHNVDYRYHGPHVKLSKNV